MKPLRVALLGFALFALVIPVQAQKDKKKDNKKPDVIVEAEKALKPGQIAGKVATMTETSMLLRLEYQHLELKDQKGRGNDAQINKAIRQQQQVAQAQQRVQRARNQQEAYRALQNLQRVVQQIQLDALRSQTSGKNSPFKVVTDHKDFNIELSGKVEFRVSNPAFLSSGGFDDMGNVKKYTAEELKELKGKGNLPGYKAASIDVKPGAAVTVTLANDKDADNKLRGTLVLVTEQGKDITPQKGKGKKK